jgi:hypothetical protein
MRLQVCLSARLYCLLLLTLLPACATSASPAKSVDPIQIETRPPPAGAKLLGSFTVVDGEGCGILATRGSYARALLRLRSKARSVGADYVQLTEVEEPYYDHQCLHQEYRLTGTAYRLHAPAPPPRSAAAQAPKVEAGPSVREAVAQAPSAELAADGLLLGARGCSVRSPAGASERSLTFSARLAAGSGFGVWLDEPEPQGDPKGLELRYDGAARRLVIHRHPDKAVVSVAAEPLELDTAWHDWRVVRAADRISVWLDDRPLLVYVTPAAGEAGFRLEGAELEIRRLVLAR